MFKYLKNDNGVALIFVIIMLVVVGGLSAALLVSARGHVGTAVHEESMAQAFHSAEAGVEFVRANIIEAKSKLENGNQGELIYPENNNGDYIIFMDNIKFHIEIIDNNKLKSVGRYNGYEKEIEFNISGSSNYNKPINIRRNPELGTDEEHFSFQGSDRSEAIEFHNDSELNFEDFKNKILDNLNIIKYEESDDDYTGEVINKVLIVNGDYEAKGKTYIKNSVLIVKDYAMISGNTQINNSLIFIYGEEKFDGRGQSGQSGYLIDNGSSATNYPDVANLPSIIDVYDIVSWEEK